MRERARIDSAVLETKRAPTSQVPESPSSVHHPNLSLDHILYLQKTIGNQAVESLLKSSIIQAKLKIGKNIIEREAGERRGRTGGEKERGKKSVNLMARVGQMPEVSPDPEYQMDGLNGGQPLSVSERAFFEHRFGHDLSRVRVHTDAKAAASARAIHAAAYSVGHDVVFGPGRFALDTVGGMRLLAHELTHIAQTGMRGGEINSLFSNVHEASELTADQNAAAVLSGGPRSLHAGGISDAFIHLAPETWYRGEAEGVGPAAPGSVPHDLGDGLYLTDNERVAQLYASTRAVGKPAGGRVLSVNIERGMLGKVLDLTADPRWKTYMETKTPGGHTYEQLIRMANENYGRFFRSFLKQHNLRIEEYDAIIGPEFVRGGNQLCIRNQRIAARVKSMASLWAGEGLGGAVSAAGQRMAKQEAPRVAEPETTPRKSPAVRPSGRGPRGTEPIPELLPGRGRMPGIIPGEGPTGAIGGAAFIIHSAQSSSIEAKEREKGKVALMERFDWILEQRAKGRWVVVRIVFEGPESVDVLGRAIGFVELPQLHFYDHLEIDTGATQEEALHPGPSIRQGPRKGRKFYSDQYVYPPF